MTKTLAVLHLSYTRKQILPCKFNLNPLILSFQCCSENQWESRKRWKCNIRSEFDLIFPFSVKKMIVVKKMFCWKIKLNLTIFHTWSDRCGVVLVLLKFIQLLCLCNRKLGLMDRTLCVPRSALGLGELYSLASDHNFSFRVISCSQIILKMAFISKPWVQ